MLIPIQYDLSFEVVVKLFGSFRSAPLLTRTTSRTIKNKSEFGIIFETIFWSKWPLSTLEKSVRFLMRFLSVAGTRSKINF